MANNTRHDQIISVLNDDTKDVKLLKIADKFRMGDIATSIWCMALRVYTLRARFNDAKNSFRDVHISCDQHM